MKGNSLNEFIDDLYHNPEKEISYQGVRYMIRGYFSPNTNVYTLEACTIEISPRTLFSHTSSERHDCVKSFVNAKIFNGMSLYEAEKDIEVLYG